MEIVQEKSVFLNLTLRLLKRIPRLSFKEDYFISDKQDDIDTHLFARN